jgi:ubiquinone/menaquinone biosynthesis C-methylase UbiE
MGPTGRELGGRVVVVAEAKRDPWAEWLLSSRHGGDPGREQEVREYLGDIRDMVLDRARLESGETLLDVGCGDGLIGFGALDRVGPDGRVIFADVSRDLLHVCRQYAQKAGVMDRCLFLLSSADRLRAVADGAVDAVTTRSVLIYVADKQACFDEFHRVLRSAGRLSVWEPINSYSCWSAHTGHTYCGYHVTAVADLAAKVVALYSGIQPSDTDPMLNFDERDLLHAAEQSGFREIHLELRVDIEPRLPAVTWDSFIRSAANPLIPTHAQAVAESLTPAEAERFEGHLRPLVETGQGELKHAVAHLWATKG